MYEPGCVRVVVVTVSREVADPPVDRLTLLGSIVAVGPGGETELVRVIDPENPLELVAVMVELPEEPSTMVRLLGFAAREKSGGPWTVIVVLVVALAPAESDTVKVAVYEPIAA